MDTIKEILELIKAKTVEYQNKALVAERLGSIAKAKRYIHQAKGLNEAGQIIINKLQEEKND